MSDITFTAIKDAIDKRADAFGLFKKTHDAKLTAVEADNASLRDRLEELESRRATPGLPGSGQPLNYKTFPTSAGDIFELPHDVKMADALPPDKKPEISFERWLGAVVAGERCQDKKAIEYVRDTKQLVTTTSGIVIPARYISAWIDKLRANMVLNAAGMSTTTMTDKTQVRSALVTDPLASWHVEAAAISVGNPTFAARELSAETLVTRCSASVELSQDSPDFGSQLTQAMARSMGGELDRVGLVGTGVSPEPLGIINTPGIGSVTGSAITDWSKFISAVQTLLTAGVPLDVATRVVVMNPYVWAKLENLPTGLSSDKTQLPVPRAFQDTRFLVTTSLPNNSPIADVAVLGDFRDLLMGIRREASVEILKLNDYAGKLVLDFIGYLRADFVVTRPASFVKITSLS